MKLEEEIATEVARIGKGKDFSDVAHAVIGCAAICYIRGLLEKGEKKIDSGPFMDMCAAAFKVMARSLADRDGYTFRDRSQH